MIKEHKVTVGDEVTCNGYDGPVIEVHAGVLTGMVDVRLASGTVCVSVRELGVAKQGAKT